MLFQRRYDEGYDLYIDADYIRWMRANHPEVDIPVSAEQDSGSLLEFSHILLQYVHFYFKVLKTKHLLMSWSLQVSRYHQYLRQHLLSFNSWQ